MHIIPVVDVRAGLAVRAIAGDRATYKPLVLDDGSSSPVSLVRWYLGVYPFSTIYVADLDGIEGRGANSPLFAELSRAYPGVAFWIDAGPTPAASGDAFTSITGTETLAGPHQVDALQNTAVLSLDFRGDDFLGPPEVLACPQRWPQRVIVMTLARVGTNAGPDIARIGEIVRRAPPGRQIYAAGGLRDAADLAAVRDAGAHGALIASALHAGKIKADDLLEIVGL